MNFTHLIRSFTNTSSGPKGRAVHAMLIKSGVSPDVYTYNHLITMYCKTNRIKDARQVFDELPQRNLISWTTLISSYSQMGMAVDALDCFRSMVIDGFVPNHYTYVSALSASASLGVSRTGKEIHARIIRFEEKLNSFVENSLVNFYGKCGILRTAISVFDGILEPNEVSWTSLVSCACQCGENLAGLKIFSRSHKAGVTVNEFAEASVLGACAAVENIELGMQVHSYAVKNGTRLDQFVVTGLVNLYAKCGDLGSAQRAFYEVEKPHLTAWTALIGGCVQQGKSKESADLFRQLHASVDGPNERTFATEILNIDPDDVSAHIMLSNIYAESKSWNEIAKIRKLMKEKVLKKDTGYSWTELKNKTYSFSSGRDANSDGNCISEVLNGLTEQLIDEGYFHKQLLLGFQIQRPAPLQPLHLPLSAINGRHIQSFFFIAGFLTAATTTATTTTTLSINL
ncbi:hypothetical protein L6452_04687 [Arctium lappa]|uniref:Uncharacterized protein n=1 Tax=Arctium lappa TaxID=4217 RepID=A0ACB9EF13_ARCLA|nr:hypothetical protein L6452_04687 [Arctium lappa]